MIGYAPFESEDSPRTDPSRKTICETSPNPGGLEETECNYHFFSWPEFYVSRSWTLLENKHSILPFRKNGKIRLNIDKTHTFETYRYLLVLL